MAPARNQLILVTRADGRASRINRSAKVFTPRFTPLTVKVLAVMYKLWLPPTKTRLSLLDKALVHTSILLQFHNHFTIIQLTLLCRDFSLAVCQRPKKNWRSEIGARKFLPSLKKRQATTHLK